MPRSFLIKKARSAADRASITGQLASDTGCPPGLDLRILPPHHHHYSTTGVPLSSKERCPPRLEEVPPRGGLVSSILTTSSRCGDISINNIPSPAPGGGRDHTGPHLREEHSNPHLHHGGGYHRFPVHHHYPHHHHHQKPPPPPAPPGRHLEQVPGADRVKTEPAFAALAPYTPTAMESSLAVRLANGYIHDMYAPSRLYPSSLPSAKDHIPNNHVTESDLDLYGKVTPREDDARSNASSGVTGSFRDDDQTSVISMDSPEDLRKPASSISNPDSGSGTGSGKAAPFQPGVTVAYTYDAFFITDGRSRRRNHLGLAIPDQPRPKYSCNECGKQYATSSNLSRHKQTHRSLESSSAKKCPHCDKVYVSMPALSMHILTHNLKHECPVCGKAFSRPWLLQGHIRSHSGEKPYGCAHCGKAFADRSNLRAHMQTHSSFKHYECKRCNKTFALKSYLNKHYESACLRDGTSDASNSLCGNSPPSSPEPFIDVQH